MCEEYHFVKIKRGSESKGTWFFKPSSEEQILEHFNTVIKGEISQGVQDYIKGCHKVENNSKPEGYWMYHSHPITPWGRAVESLWHLNGGTWLEASIRLENEVINNRLRNFRNGKEMYLDNGVIETRIIDTDEIIDEKWEDTLLYPLETQVRIENVRYMQWNMPDLHIKGTHWYAKIGNLDIKDEKGNMKWDTKAEAEAAAEMFVRKLNAKRYDE